MCVCDWEFVSHTIVGLHSKRCYTGAFAHLFVRTEAWTQNDASQFHSFPVSILWFCCVPFQANLFCIEVLDVLLFSIADVVFAIPLPCLNNIGGEGQVICTQQQQYTQMAIWLMSTKNKTDFQSIIFHIEPSSLPLLPQKLQEYHICNWKTAPRWNCNHCKWFCAKHMRCDALNGNNVFECCV